MFTVDDLSRGERRVCELMQMVGADMLNVPKHLSVLKFLGIIKEERRGLQVYHQIKMLCVLRTFDRRRVVAGLRQRTAEARRDRKKEYQSEDPDTRYRLQEVQTTGAENAEAAAQQLGVENEIEKITE